MQSRKNKNTLGHRVLQNHPPQHTHPLPISSFGIILWELLTLLVPFEDVPVVTIIFWVVSQDKRPALPADLRTQLGDPPGLDEYIHLMQACWARDPAARPTFSQVAAQLRLIRRKGSGGLTSHGSSGGLPRAVSDGVGAAKAGGLPRTGSTGGRPL